MDNLNRQFGILIAYILPGFIALSGLVPLIPAVSGWLQPINHGEAGLGPPLYSLMAAAALGMLANCFRWLLVDHLLELTGIPKPVNAYYRLEEKLGAFDYLIDVHYRHYQFYSNALVAVIWSYGIHRGYQTLPLLGWGTDLGIVVLSAVLLAVSRDTLSKYRRKLGQLLEPIAEKDNVGVDMANGADHHNGAASTKKPQTEAKPTSIRPQAEEGKNTKATK